MKADHLSYSRAASVCLLGLLLQVVMGLALLIYSVQGIGNDHTAFTSACMVLLGSMVWVALAIVFDQHRRERVEALEAETLSAVGGRTASVFEQNPEDLRIAARRLAWMHRILLPTISVLLAGAYIGIGVWRLLDAQGRLDPDKFALPRMGGWGIAIGLGMAVVGFIFARFVSGMAKQGVWANLRGGAAAAVGAALLGLALAVAHFVRMAGSDILLRYMQVIVPAVLIFLGAEILLNLLLNLYRPRRAGEVARPAMDSRVLAFIASPDRLAESIGGAISYQFGVDVTGSWAYRLLSRSVLLLVLVGAGVIWLLTCLEVIEPNERAIRVRNGANLGEVGPGLYVKLPWPLERLDTVPATVVQKQQLATMPDDKHGPILWTNDHAVSEVFAMVQPSRAGRQSSTATGFDVSMLAVEIPLRYNIKDLQKYELLATPSTREGLIKAVAQREALGYLATCDEDDVLGRRLTQISHELQRRIQVKLDSMNAGVQVLMAAVEGAHPTKQAAKDFEEVVKSIQNRAGKIEQGRTEAIKTLTSAVGSLDLAREIADEIDHLEAIEDNTESAKAKAAQAAKVEEMVLKAGGKAGATIATARSDRWRTHMLARGNAEAFPGLLAAYRAAPELYRADRYLAAIREMMKGARVYITSDDPRHGLRMNVDLKDLETTGSIMPSGTESK